MCACNATRSRAGRGSKLRRRATVEFVHLRRLTPAQGNFVRSRLNFPFGPEARCSHASVGRREPGGPQGRGSKVLDCCA